MYEDRVLAFIDVLGFADAVKRTIKKGKEDQAETKRIAKLFEFIQFSLNHDKDPKYSLPKNSKIVNHFSDSIVISYLLNENLGIHNILFDIYLIQYNAMMDGFLLRGAIVCDKVYHTETVIFGPAMVRAYDLERKIAIYPRIILDNKIIDIVNNFSEIYYKKDMTNWLLDGFIKNDFDGQYYLDYFFYMEPGKDEVIEENFLRFSLIGRIIKSIEKIDSIGVKSKYLWLKEKYDEAFNNEVNKLTDKKLSSLTDDFIKDYKAGKFSDNFIKDLEIQLKKSYDEFIKKENVDLRESNKK
jgi:lipid-A-disaccharide synthase-like uncharacterized protein